MTTERLNQVNGHLPSGNADSDNTYKVTEQPLGTRRPIRIITIGAGASGLNLIRTLRQRITNYTHVVYEANPQVGGTWYENRYPGCRCDIPSHNYQFSWRPNPEWSSFFSPAEEIGAYLCRLCEEQGMESEIRLNHRVVDARWEKLEGFWRVRVKSTETGEEFEDQGEVLINAGGILNNWKWPDIPGLHDFQGGLVHSAAWPKDFDYRGKTVAVIGNGSSGIQIVPEMQPHVNQLVHFVRSPTWIVPPRLQLLSMGKTADIMSQIEVDGKGDFTQAQISKFKSDPAFYKRFVKQIEEDVNGNFPTMLKDTEKAKGTMQQLGGYMEMMLNGDERLCNAIIPKFAVGCRRLTPGIGYLEALQASNTRVVTDRIRRVVPQGIETTTGEVIAIDAIVCATGFDVSFCPRFPFVGPMDNLQDRWRQGVPKSYMSCAVPGMPNYFTFLGPNAPCGHGSIFTVSEHIARYIARAITKLQTESLKSMAPSYSAVNELYEHSQAFMPRTAWASSCSSWFKGGKTDGAVTALHPGGRIHFFHMLEGFRGEDWEYEYAGGRRNRFAYLGNGFSTMEADGEDSTWYLNEPDELP